MWSLTIKLAVFKMSNAVKPPTKAGLLWVGAAFDQKWDFRISVIFVLWLYTVLENVAYLRFSCLLISVCFSIQYSLTSSSHFR